MGWASTGANRPVVSVLLAFALALGGCADADPERRPSPSPSFGSPPAAIPSNAGPVTPTGTYTDVHWPEGTYSSFEWTLRIKRDPTPAGYFWAHQFGFAGGEGGYLGLQTLGGDPAKPPGKVAIFSIWSALGAEGPGYSDPFGGEGTGFTARIDYPWTVERDYRLRVERVEPGAPGAWWAAWVRDEGTQQEQLVGHIRVPPAWGLLSSASVVWTERYAGEASSCRDLGFSEVEFTSLSAQGGLVVPKETKNHLAEPPGSCRNSKISDVTGGVRHEMGVSP